LGLLFTNPGAKPRYLPDNLSFASLGLGVLVVKCVRLKT
jgi:hypothetical protein